MFVCLFVHGTGPRHRDDLVSGQQYVNSLVDHVYVCIVLAGLRGGHSGIKIHGGQITEFGGKNRLGNRNRNRDLL